MTDFFANGLSFGEAVHRAVNDAFLDAAKLAKQTGTPLVVWQNNMIVKIPPLEIDAFVSVQTKS